MSFQAYIDNIVVKTGKSIEEIRSEATVAGVLHEDMKARKFCDWLVSEYDLGHGHAMALWNLFIGNGWITTKYSELSKRA